MVLPTDEHSVLTKEVEHRGVEAVLTAKCHLGRNPVQQALHHPGYDVLSELPDGSTLRITVKARMEGASNFFISHNELLKGKNAALDIVGIRPCRRARVWTESSALPSDPFAMTSLGDFNATDTRGDCGQGTSTVLTDANVAPGSRWNQNHLDVLPMVHGWGPQVTSPTNSLACPLHETTNSSLARVAATYSKERSRSRASARASGE